MKVNAPERIWIDPATDLPKLSGHIDKDSVEYTRTYAFIEKAAKWIEENLSEYCDGEDIEYTLSSTYNVTILQNERMIEDFKKAMMV